MSGALWGVDSAAAVSVSLLNCVKTHYGMPEFWGRYLKTVPGAAEGLTRQESAFLRQHGIKILPIYSDFREAVGYAQGRIRARNAIYLAKLLGIPRQVAIFANVERFFAVDEAWIRGWADVFYNSDYKPGYYFDPKQGGFSAAYCHAASRDDKVLHHTILWSAEPAPGVTPKRDAPRYDPAGPPCSANVWAWQYGRDSKTCPVDTDLISPLLEKHLWR